MDDVLSHVVIAVSDEYLLAENAITAVGLRFGARTYRRQILNPPAARSNSWWPVHWPLTILGR